MKLSLKSTLVNSPLPTGIPSSYIVKVLPYSLSPPYLKKIKTKPYIVCGARYSNLLPISVGIKKDDSCTIQKSSFMFIALF
jgi:hypothetical protein